MHLELLLTLTTADFSARHPFPQPDFDAFPALLDEEMGLSSASAPHDSLCRKPKPLDFDNFGFG